MDILPSTSQNTGIYIYSNDDDDVQNDDNKMKNLLSIKRKLKDVSKKTIGVPSERKAMKSKRKKPEMDLANLSQQTQELQRKEKARVENRENNDTDGRFYKPIDYLPSNLPEENRLPNETIKEQIDDGQQDEIRFEQIIQRRPIKEIACIDLSSEDDSENTPNGELQQQKTPFWQLPQQTQLEQFRLAQRGQIINERRDPADYEKKEYTAEGRLLINTGKPKGDPDAFIAPHLTHTLQPHQIGGVKFMYDNIIESLETFKKSDGNGCVLAHSMGLGKTIQAIAFIELFIRMTGRNRVLVICPVNVLQNWNCEFQKWLPKINPEIYSPLRDWDLFILGDNVKTYEARAQLLNDWHNSGGVLLIGYEMFRLLIQRDDSTLSTKATSTNTNGRRKKKLSKKQQNAKRTLFDLEEGLSKIDEEQKQQFLQKEEVRKVIKEALVSPGPDLVICDEGHRIKSLNTEVANALTAIPTRRRVVLTGYPLQNNLMEYYCMVEFVRPGYLGTRKEFISIFEKPIRNGQCIDSTKRDIKLAKQRIHVLTNLLRGFVQRRTQHLLKKILPESREFVLLLRKSPIQHALYRAFYHYAIGQVNAGESSFNPLKGFAICMKIVNHPDLLYEAMLKKQKLVKDMMENNDQLNIANQLDPSADSAASSYSQYPSPFSKSNQQGTDQIGYPGRRIPQCEIPSPSTSGLQQNPIQSSYYFPQQNQRQLQYFPQVQFPQNLHQPWLLNAGQLPDRSRGEYGHSMMASTSTKYGNCPPNQQPREYFPPLQSSSNSPPLKYSNPNYYPLSQPNFSQSAGTFFNHHSTQNQRHPYIQQCNTSANYLNNDYQQRQRQFFADYGFGGNQQNGHTDESIDIFKGTFLDTANTDGGKSTAVEDQKQNGQIKQNIGVGQIENGDQIREMRVETQKSASTAATEEQPKSAANKAQIPMKRKPKNGEVHDLLSDEFLFEDNSISLEWAEPLLNNYMTGLLENSSKMFLSMQIISETIRRGQKILLFSQSVITLNLIEAFLKKLEVYSCDGQKVPLIKNKTYCRLDGTTSGSDREKLIRRFNESPQLHLFLISTKAGSLGVNLVSANRVIIFDVSWNPCHDAQAVCRIYRYGQKQKTFIYRLIMGNSMERQVFNRQISKQGLQRRVIDEQMIDANVTTREVENLMEYNEAKDVISTSVEQPYYDDKQLKTEYDDELLTDLLCSNGRWFLESPFLHESMMLESEEGLSKEEKMEAELLYQREKQGINFPPTAQEISLHHQVDAMNRNRRMGIALPGAPAYPYGIYNNQRISQSTPFPKHIQLAAETQRMAQMQQHMERVRVNTQESPVEMIKEVTLPKVICAEGDVPTYTLYPKQQVTTFASSCGLYVRTMDGVILDASKAIRMGPIFRQSNPIPLQPPLIRHQPKKICSDEIIQIDD